MADAVQIQKLIDNPSQPNAVEWAMDAEDVLYEFSDLAEAAAVPIKNIKHFGDAFPNRIDAVVALLKRALLRTSGKKYGSEVSDMPDANCSIFIVHGHDAAMKSEVARVLEQQGLDALVLSEQPANSMTIIEKLEYYAKQSAFAIVLYSKDDASDSGVRARQNVVFEHGLFVGCLGRNRVIAMKNGDVEGYSDIAGIEYIHYESSDWKYKLVESLKLAGFDVSRDRIKG